LPLEHLAATRKDVRPVNSRPYRPPHVALDQVAPRSARPDPRADPDEGAPESSPPPPRNSGRVPAARVFMGGDQVGELEEANRAAERRIAELSEERHTLAERIGELEIEATHRTARFEQRVAELEAELARRSESEAMLELMAGGQATESDRVRRKSEEIQALHLAIDCAHAENLVLMDRLARERAEKEGLHEDLARLQSVVDELRRRTLAR
jgi:hypothetical protein